MYDTIIYEVNDPVATITLNRPEAMNAWTNSMDREIREAVAKASADPTVVGIIVTGAGVGVRTCKLVRTRWHRGFFFFFFSSFSGNNC